MSQFNAAIAKQAISGCLRSGEVLSAFAEGSDEGGMPRSGMWADAGTTWLGITTARILAVPSANGEVWSTPWPEVASVAVKAGLVGGGRFAFANTTFPASPSAYKVDRAFAKQAQAVWVGPKTTLPAESTSVTRGLYQRLNDEYWFCDACGQPCGTPLYSQTPHERCKGCLRTVTGVAN